MKMKHILSLLLCIAALLTSLTARSEELTLTTWFTDSSLHGGTARVSIDGSGFYSVAAGELLATTGSGFQWKTFCTDLSATLASGPFTSLTLDAAQSLPAWQTPDWAPGGLARATGLFMTYRDDVTTPREAVALQTLIWEVLYDTDPSLNSGRFQLSPSGTTAGAFNRATSWLNSAPEYQLTGSEVWWGPSTESGGYRVGQGLPGDAVIVPESSSVLLLGAVIPIVAFTLWRNRRRS